MRYLLLIMFPFYLSAKEPLDGKIENLQAQAHRITIIRDNWGVPHIYGKTDADAAFGIMYAQCEDNYWQLEETMINSLGRSAELYGESRLQNDVAVARFECISKAKELHASTTPFIRSLCKAASDGINYFLLKNPSVERRLLQVYEPWFFLLPSPASPGSHGISGNDMRLLSASFPAKNIEGSEAGSNAEKGSNTMALAPRKTTSGKSMLLINPHVGFFGEGQRYEAHLVSDEGLNVSGFAIFGTFYIWSGFNQYTGWAHTNTASDYDDVYLEYFNHPSDSNLYRYDAVFKKANRWSDTLLYLSPDGMKKRVFSFLKTHHGPIVAIKDTFLVSIKVSADDPAEYISQSWAMCRSRNIKEFTSAMAKRQLATNTMYADRYGNISYWHGNSIPKRDSAFDWRLPVDGSKPKTEWKGKHALGEIVQVHNPYTGWIQNSNSTPFLASGIARSTSKYPRYMAYEGQNFRGEEGVRLLSKQGKISFAQFEKLVTSNHLMMMKAWLPKIINAYDEERSKDTSLFPGLKSVIDTLRKWDYQYSLRSTATSIAISWFYEFMDWVRRELKPSEQGEYLRNLGSNSISPTPSASLKMLSDAVDTLDRIYGTKFIAWGELNRLQRIHTSGTMEKFDDNKSSLPVDAAPGLMGSLFAFNIRAESGQKKLYGTGGNTYVAVVEFGNRVRAKSIVNFGQSADPSSPHFFDQAPLYAKGEFKEVYFYRADVEKHAVRKYHPGE